MAEVKMAAVGDVEAVDSARRRMRGALALEKTSIYLSGKLLRCEKLLLSAERQGMDSTSFRNRMIVNMFGETSDGQRFLFTPMLSNGNCGFLTVAVGVNRLTKSKYSSYDIRKILCEEVRSNRSFYISEALKNPAHRYQMEDDLDFSDFERSVMKTGWNGHWLGEKWGMLEIKSIARALGLHIEVFCHDEKSNSLRSYHQEKYGDKFLGMFFSGVSNKGHFDLLLKEIK